MRKLIVAIAIALPALSEPQLPQGFHLDVFARDLVAPHAVLALEDGTVLVSRPGMNDVVALRDRDGDGRADEMRTAVASIEQAHGLTMRGRVLYVAGVKKIVAAERMPDGSFGEAKEVVTDLPDGGQHPNRAIGAGPDGKLYVAIGSSCADCAESNPEHATILQLDPDGSRRIYARGLRNAAAFDWHPSTKELWAADAGEINRIGDGLHYGWPLCARDTSVQPEGITREKFCRSAAAAALELQSRAEPKGFAFDRTSGDAFSLVDNDILRIRFSSGAVGSQPASAGPAESRPLQGESFIRGLSGKLAGLAMTADGALLVTDARNGVVYRISRGEQLPPPMISSSAEATATPVLAKAFGVENLRGPGAVLHDEEQDVYFVSNVDGSPSAKDGKGFIARIAPDGTIADLKFIDGLDAPKGMAIRGIELWIADIDLLRVFDRVTGAPLAQFDLSKQGAVFLRDIAIGPDNAVYVTDTDVRIKGEREQVREGDGRVFRVLVDGETDDATVEIAMSGEELRSPSGIAWDGTRFLIAQTYGKEVLAWNHGGGTKAVMRGPGAYDGLVVLPNGAVIVSSHHDHALHVAHGAGELRPLFARKPSPSGIGFDRKRNRLLIPSADGDWLEAWTLPPMDAPQTTSTRDGRTEFARW